MENTVINHNLLENKMKNSMSEHGKGFSSVQGEISSYIKLLKSQKPEENLGETKRYEMEGIQNKMRALLSHSTNIPKEYYKKTQRWLGTIITLEKDSFTAKLEDLNSPDTYEVAAFDLDDISLGDRSLVAIGKVFYWSVGYYVARDGQIKKESLIRFQRLPQWTETDIDEVTDKAKELHDTINWD